MVRILINSGVNNAELVYYVPATGILGLLLCELVIGWYVLPFVG
jgi:hypothetical protein